ncbi:MAG: TAXI family TRAP transporter solute-binding subunit [Rhodospirillaceae bacterium]
MTGQSGNIKRPRTAWLVVLAMTCVAAGLAATDFGADAWAASRSTGSSSSSSSSSSWTSKSSQPRTSGSLWDRSAPTTAPTSSGGYAKPGPSVAPISSGGYAKPAAVGAAVVTGGAAAAAAATTTPANSNTPPASANLNQPQSGIPGKTMLTSGSSGGYAKPTLGGTPAAAIAGGSGNGGSGNGTTGGSKPPASALDRGAERQLSSQSMSRYKAEQERFQAPSQGTLTGASDYAKNPLFGAGAGRYRSYDQAYAERDTYRNSHPWAPSPYVYRSAPSFGMWDAMFLWMVLDKVTEPSHAAAAYNNQNDPGFQAWRREADRMAQDNSELKAKLAVMDSKLDAMKGQPQKPGVLPDGLPAVVALAPEVAVAPRDAAPKLVMGTGGLTGNYYPFCQGAEGIRGLRAALKEVAVECRTTNGSIENLDGLVSGRFDAILVQSDVYDQWLSLHPNLRIDALQATVYREYVQMLANKQAKVERISDLDPKRHTIYLVGSGAQKTWDGFAAQDARYGAFETAGRIRRVPNDPQVLDTVAANPDAVMMFVAGLKAELLRQANDRQGDKLVMALVDDQRLDDARDRAGHPIYALAKIPSGIYPKLQKSRWFGLTSSVTSLTVGAVFILSERWVAEHGVSGLSKVEAALWRTIPEIEKKVGVGG